MPTNNTKNTLQRQVRQDALREQLQSQGHLQHVIELTDKIKDERQDIDPAMVKRLEIVINTKMKLIGKFLPDLKSVDLNGNGPNGEITLVVSSKDAEL